MNPSEFARLIYKDVPAEVGSTNITIWNRQDKKSVHVALPNDTVSANTFDDIVANLVANNRDVYFGVGLRRPALTKDQRGKVADVRGLPGLFLDIDLDRGNLPAGAITPHAAKNLPKSDANACEILACLPEPSVIVDSGHGWHVYWLFDKVHPVGYLDTNAFNRASEQFQRKAISHAETLGWHVDNTSTIDRILRLPGTINTKAGLNVPVEVIMSDGPRYGSLNSLLQAAQIDARTSLPDAVIKPIDTHVDQSLLAPRENHAKAQSTEWIKENLDKLHNPESRELMEKVLKGEPFANPGDRDRTLQRIASILAYLAPDRSPDEIAKEILGPSLQHHDDVDAGKYTQADRIEWAAEKISRAQEDARRDRVLKERADQALADVLLKHARSAPRRDQRLGPAQLGAYTDQEIAAFAAQQNTTSQQFNKRWVIQKGQSFYVYVNGDYQLPISTNELDVSLPRDLSPAVAQGYIKLDTLNSKGEPRNKTTKEILSDYCSVARTVVADLSLGFSRYDENTQTFYEAVCPIRPLEPVFVPEIDQWLKLLGGPKADKLIDWIATVTVLDRQSSALYIQGPPGCGKSLLGQGLARLWHLGGPTELIRVLGEWSHDIARCPLIAADEQIPQSFKGQRTSAELRSLIGSSSRTLTRKYLSNADLVGAVRLILSANNADMLVFEESLSQADLEAVSGRFLHIDRTGDKSASTYLQSIDTSGWVDDDMIAKHALWLRDNHTVAYGRRFAVEGSAEEVSKMLATRGGLAGRVAEWLVRFICEMKNTPQATQAGLVIIGNGKYLVNTNAVVSFWDTFVKSSKVPSTPQVGSALRNLSNDQVKVGTRRYFEIDIDAISQWSEQNLVGDPEIIKSKISQVAQMPASVGVKPEPKPEETKPDADNHNSGN